jgi:hypothetical protein
VFGRVAAVADEVVVPVAGVPAAALGAPEPLDAPAPEVCGLGDSGCRLPLDPPESDEPSDPDPESELPSGSSYCWSPAP